MSMQDLAAALQRVEKVLQRRPDMGLHDDAPATARWQSGTRVVSSHANGTQVVTDMPTELGGTGDRVTPGWLLRAGLAVLRHDAHRDDCRGRGHRADYARSPGHAAAPTRVACWAWWTPMALPCAPGRATCSCTSGFLRPGFRAERLRALVKESCRCSPIPAALQNAVPITLRIEVGAE